MFDFISGTLIRKDAGGVVVSLGGMGYHLSVPQRTLSELPDSGEVTLYSHLVVKEDSLRLFGFQTPLERDLFLKIMSVSGIGAALALSLLSEITPRQFADGVARENIALFQRVKGIGARTAKRLVLELKDKMEWMEALAHVPEAEGILDGAPLGDKAQDLVAALLALGFPRLAARDAAAKALSANSEDESLENLIKAALLNI